jgi:ankyrin repeat protein
MVSMLASCSEMTVAGRSAQEAFHDEGVVSLLHAVRNNDTNEAKRLIDRGVNINAMGKGGVTPLIWMQGMRDLTAMKLLLELGADPNEYMVNGIGSPLWLAAGGGRIEELRLLLEHGADPNRIYGIKTPLMMAVSGSHLDCAELLLQYGANINFTNGPMSVLDEAMIHVQFGDALWVLNHGYTHDLPMARRMLEVQAPRRGQEELKVKALQIVNRLLAEQKKTITSFF